MSRKFFYCPFWLKALENEQGSSLNVAELPDCHVVLKRLLECDSCSYHTDKKIDLIIHIAQKHRTLIASYSAPRDGSETTASDKRLRCSDCNLTTRFPEVLRWHIKHCHGENPVIRIIYGETGKNFHFQCILCGVECSDNGSMAQHLHRHNIEYPFQCEICKERFSLDYNLAMHQLTHYNVVGWRCHICKASFKSKVVFNKHLTEAHKLHICERCNSTFKKECLLRKHLVNKHARYLCTICKKLCRSKNALSNHRKFHKTPSAKSRSQHSTPTPDTRRCSKRVIEQNESQIEKYNPRKLHCKFCKLTFFHQAYLKQHMVTVHASKMLPCTICGRKFMTQVCLRYHIRNVHNGQFLYCEHCDYFSRNRSLFLQHWRRLHMHKIKMNKIHQLPNKESIQEEILPKFIEITHKVPTTRTYGNRKLLSKKVEDVKPNV